MTGLVLAVSALMAACGRREPPEHLVRLTDRLAEAVVESPLVEAPALRESGPIRRTEVFRPDFDNLDGGDLGWGVGKGIGRLEEGGGAWCHGSTAPNQIPIVLPAIGGARYRIRRRIRSEDPELDLQVLERSTSLGHPERLNHPDDLVEVRSRGFKRGRDLLVIHRFPRPEPGVWRQDEIDILTTWQTRSLVLMFTRAEETAAGAHLDGCVDELAVERLEPTAAQELALLRQWRSTGEPTGLVKRGQLLTLPPIHRAEPPRDRNLDHREAILAPPPTRLGFTLDLPEEARFTFAFAAARTSRAGSVAGLQVWVEEGGESTVLVDEGVAVGPDGETGTWSELDVDLSAWGGRRVTLGLTTSAPGGEPAAHVLIANPTVDRPRVAGDPPNLLLIGVDTLRTDALSLFGNPRATSPNLEALADEGVWFEQAVTSAPWTAPSFATLFTGLMPSRHGVVHRMASLPHELETLPERLRDGGWRTWTIAFKPYLYNLGFEQGFDVWHNVPRMDRTAQDGLERTVEFLERHGDRPFFLFLHIDDAHQPMRPPPPFDTRFATSEAMAEFGVTLPENLGFYPFRECENCRTDFQLDPEYVQLVRDVYEGSVAFLDDRIGVVLAELAERGLYDDTVVAVVSDHGETMFDRNLVFGHGNAVYEELVRGLLIVKPHAAAGVPGGRVVDAQVRMADVPPTLLDLLGLPTDPPTPESSSLLRLMTGDAPARSRPAVSEDPRRGLAGVRFGDWKYQSRFATGRSPRESLFHLSDDPKEMHDVAAEHPETLARFRPLLIRHWLRNRGGHYLLATGDGAGPWKVEIEGRPGLELLPLVGLAGSPGRDLPARLTAGDGRLWGLVEISDPDSLTTASLQRDGSEITRRGPEDWQAAESGLVEDLLASRTAGLYLLEVEAGPVVEAKTVQSAENLEALRALGYLD